MGNRKIKDFVIENRIEELPSLSKKIEVLGSDWKLPQQLVMNINLVVEEAISNIIFYAFNDHDRHKIGIAFSMEDEMLTIKFTDDGIRFNPLLHEQPDVTLPLKERSVGGLGIFLISQIMDDMHYERTNNQNILILNKRL